MKQLSYNELDELSKEEIIMYVCELQDTLIELGEMKSEEYDEDNED